MSDAYVWGVIAALAAATYAIRASFLAAGADSAPSPRTARLLRYVPTAVLPALAAPLALLDAQKTGLTETPALIAAAATLAVGAGSGRFLLAAAAGMAALHAGRAAGL